MTSTVATLAGTTRIEDPGRMPEGRDRPDPEVPERPRRRTELSPEIALLCTAFDALARRVRRHEEQIRQLTSRTS